MKNNKLIVELHRINKLMNLNENVASVGGGLINTIKKFIKSYEPKTIKKLLKKDELLPDLNRIVNLTGDELIESINALLSRMDVDKLAKELIKDGWGYTSREKLINGLVKKLNEQKNIKDKIRIYQSFIKKQTEMTSDTYSNMKIEGMNSFNKLVDKLSYQSKQSFDRKFKEEIGDVTYRQLITKPTSISDGLVKFVNRELGDNLTSIRRYIANSAKNQDKLNEDFINVLQQSFNAKQLGQSEDFFIKKLQDILASKKKGVNDDLKNMLETIRQKLLNNKDEVSKQQIKYLDEIIGSDNILNNLIDMSKKSGGSFLGELGNVIKKYRNMLWPLKNEQGVRQWGEMFRRQAMFIITANPNLPSEIYSQLLKQGLVRTVAIRIVNSYVANLIIYPMMYGIYSAFKSIVTSFGNLFSKEIEEESRSVEDFIKDAFPAVSGKYWKLTPFNTFIPEFIRLVSDVRTFVTMTPITLRNWVNSQIGSEENDLDRAQEAIKKISQENSQQQKTSTPKNNTKIEKADW